MTLQENEDRQEYQLNRHTDKPRDIGTNLTGKAKDLPVHGISGTIRAEVPPPHHTPYEGQHQEGV